MSRLYRRRSPFGGGKVEADRAFNPYRYAAGENAKAIVTEAITTVGNYEKFFGLRQNKRRLADKETLEITVDALLSDLMHNYLLERHDAIYVTRSNTVLGTKSRYRPRAYSKMFPHVLDILSSPELPYIVQDIAPPLPGVTKSTTIRPGPRLIERLIEHEVELDDLEECEPKETIILKRQKDCSNFWDPGGWQEYEDVDVPNGFREEVDEINDWLTSADLSFDPTGLPWPQPGVDLQARRLRRIFTQGRFSSGGRLFGGFWQQLKKEERLHGLRIADEQTVELDYGQVSPRLLYGMKGLTVSAEDDLYHVARFAERRSGIKKVMNAMIFSTEPLARFPAETKALFHRNDKIAHVTSSIEERHPAIADLFYQGHGHEIQFVESQVLISVLLRLKKQGIVALPIHDAIMVPSSKAELATHIMLEAFSAIGGVKASVSVIHANSLGQLSS